MDYKEIAGNTGKHHEPQETCMEQLTTTIVQKIRSDNETTLIKELTSVLKSFGYPVTDKCLRKKLDVAIKTESAMNQIQEISRKEGLSEYDFTNQVMEVITKWRRDTRVPWANNFAEDDPTFVPGLVTE